ncbi:alcohol dehydrogenase [Histoplasma capsulatum G186AR]|uniref:Alcohol dehydrogenase n=1 Tax=Ajellomyces capsulatus (strain G186AR / H82 / ATCC MYA-2454 / RMSCC 2432) TaxID=447093 RepID=C0NDU8_AJECG|nr:alcohol dehydrogenase [Histoplasma capsulatum G186AR]EEH10396.1 alcohol dehydrogenase [Histoplasma capsulatum G186AR]
MVQSICKTTKQWSLAHQNGFDALKFTEEPVRELEDHQVLVKLQGAALNARDLIIIHGVYPIPIQPNVVPGSDGAGTVLAVGKNVTRFKPGDKVTTTINQQHIAGPMTIQASRSGLGCIYHGTLRTVGAFDERGLVPMPAGLSFTEAATLGCAGLTAWNALFGLPGKQILPGQWVLTQGTGGFAKAVGATVIATTGSAEKARLLEKLGVDHIINYQETPGWGAAAKALTPGGLGVDIVIDVVGAATLKQSVASVKLDGIINLIGFMAPQKHEEVEPMPGLIDALMGGFTARGVWTGSLLQMEEMCRAIEANVDKLRPVLDSKVFTLEQTREAYEYLASRRHFGKVVINIS